MSVIALYGQSSSLYLISWSKRVSHGFGTLCYHITSTNVWQNVCVSAFLPPRQPYLVPQQIESEWGRIFAVQTASHVMSKRVRSAIVLGRLSQPIL